VIALTTTPVLLLPVIPKPKPIDGLPEALLIILKKSY
jgi:hypothetical protein